MVLDSAGYNNRNSGSSRWVDYDGSENRPRRSSPTDALHGIEYPDNMTPERLAARDAAAGPGRIAKIRNALAAVIHAG